MHTREKWKSQKRIGLMPKRKRYEQDTQAHPGCLSKGSLYRKLVCSEP